MKQEESAVSGVLIPSSRTTCGKKKRHFDELAKTRLTNAEQHFRITVFNCVIDVVTSQLTQQFTAMNNIAAKFSVISQVSCHPYQNMTSYHKSQLYRKNTPVIKWCIPVQLSTTMHSLYTTMSCKQFWGVGTRAPDPRGPPPALQGLQGRLLRHCSGVWWPRRWRSLQTMIFSYQSHIFGSVGHPSLNLWECRDTQDTNSGWATAANCHGHETYRRWHLHNCEPAGTKFGLRKLSCKNTSELSCPKNTQTLCAFINCSFYGSPQHIQYTNTS